MEHARSTEDDLLARAARGDRAALGRLLDGERRRLIRMVDLRIDPCVQGRFSASDVVQETFLEAFQRWDEQLAHPEVPLRQWLRSLARQQLAAHHRQHVLAGRRDARREAAGPFPTSSPLLVDEVIGRMTSPSAAADRSEVRRQVDEALALMDPVDREVLILRQFERLSNTDAARELDLSPVAASKRFVRALERLGNLLRRSGNAH